MDGVVSSDSLTKGEERHGLKKTMQGVLLIVAIFDKSRSRSRHPSHRS